MNRIEEMTLLARKIDRLGAGQENIAAFKRAVLPPGREALRETKVEADKTADEEQAEKSEKSDR